MNSKRLPWIVGKRRLFSKHLKQLSVIEKTFSHADIIETTFSYYLGMDISPIDLINIESFANRVIHLFEYRKSLQEVRQNYTIQ